MVGISFDTKIERPNEPPFYVDEKVAMRGYCLDTTSLMDAAFKGDIEKVKSVINEGYIDDQNRWGTTALIHAATKGHIEVVKLLDIPINSKTPEAFRSAFVSFFMDRENISR